MYNLLNRNLNNWYHMYRGMRQIFRRFFVVFMEQITRGGRRVDVKFWTLDGQEKANNIEQVQTRKKFESFGDNVMIECPSPHPWKVVYYWKNQKIYQKFQHLFKADLILLANISTPSQYSDSCPSPILLRVMTCRLLAFCSWLTESTLRKD